VTDALGFSQSIAVLIGIDRYRHDVPPLRSAVNDASRIAETLEQQHGYRTVLLLDEQATRAALLDLIERQLPEQVGSDDRVLFYFAGHGVAISGDDGPQGYLLPQDASRGDASGYLEMAQLHEALMSLPCRHMLIVLDSCFSGAFRWSGRRDVVLDQPTVYRERFNRFLQDPAWQLITSAAHDQTAADQWHSDDFGGRGDRGPHSPFAEALLEALSGGADLVPPGGDGVITATELYLFLEDRLQPRSMQFGVRQTPGLWPLRKHDKGEFIFLVPGRERDLPSAPVLTVDNNPYRGLTAFESRHSDVFFGRESAIGALMDKIRHQALTVVLGASGTGKSSLVKAGVVPRLATESDWQVLPMMRPGSEPMRALQAALGAAAELAPSTAACSAALERLLAATDARLVLVIDQFEELLTLTRSAEQRARFLDQLAAMLSGSEARLHLVLTLRSDFEGLFDHSPLAALWQVGRFVVPAMSRADLRAAIEGPAQQRVLYFEPSSLVEQLVDEVAAMPGGLALLSFTLSEMYLRYIGRASDDRCLVQADYEALGGVVGALRSRADAELAALDPAEQASLRRLMLRMLQVQHGALVRQRVSESQLRNTDPQESARLQQVLTRLIEARLVVRGVDDRGQVFVEPAHDALVSSWGQLLQWVHEAQEQEPDLPFLHALQRSAEEWSVARPADRSGLLWRDKLRSRRLWSLLRKEPFQLSQTEDRFCRASVARWRLLRNTAAGLVAGLALFALLATALGLVAEERRDQAEQRRLEAERQTRLAQANALTAAARGALDGEGDATLGFKLAAAALGLDPEHQPALWLLRKALYGTGFIVDRGSIISTPFARRLGTIVHQAGWSPDGCHIATWRDSEDDSGVGELVIYSRDGRRRSATLVNEYALPRFDRSGRYLLWPEPFALDLDGQRVSSSMLATLEPWHPGGLELVYEGELGTPWYRASSADGRVQAGLLLDQDAIEEAFIADALEFGVIKDGVSIRARCEACNQVALRADGTMMATADLDGQISLWKFVPEWEEAWRFATLRRGSREAMVSRLEFSVDGSRLLAVDWRGQAWLWQIGWLDLATAAGDIEPPTEADRSPIQIEVDRSALGNDTPYAVLKVTEPVTGMQWQREFVTSDVSAGVMDDTIILLDDQQVWLLDATGSQALPLPLDPSGGYPNWIVRDPAQPLTALFAFDGDAVALNAPRSAEAIIGLARQHDFLEIGLEDQLRWDVQAAIASLAATPSSTAEDSQWAALKRRLGLATGSESRAQQTSIDEPPAPPLLPAPWQVLLDQTPLPSPPIDPYEEPQPVRWIATELGDAGLLQALQSMAPPAMYRSGPHPDGQWNLHSEQFGHYNPAFVEWLAETLLPESRDAPMRRATQAAYDRHLRRLARVHWIAWRALNESPGIRDDVIVGYSALASGRGDYLFCALQPLIETVTPIAEAELDEVVHAAGFWVRRQIDGTAPLFEQALCRALERYDPDFLARPAAAQPFAQRNQRVATGMQRRAFREEAGPGNQNRPTTVRGSVQLHPGQPRFGRSSNMSSEMGAQTWPPCKGAG
jgi:hypothetical protein